MVLFLMYMVCVVVQGYGGCLQPSYKVSQGERSWELNEIKLYYWMEVLTHDMETDH